jgi:Calcineurin-like phosphoesterase
LSPLPHQRERARVRALNSKPHDNTRVKIQLLSDLHIDANPNFTPTPAPEADVCVLAGDVAPYGDGLELFKHWPVPVLYVPGNHEYDKQDYDEAHRLLRARCESNGLVWLERAVWQHASFKQVRFVGANLWTDFDALAASMPARTPLTQRLQAREKAFSAANFYLLKTGTTKNGAPFDAAAVREEAISSQAWLNVELSRPFAGKTVVVTHFAPSLKSADPRYGLQPGTAGFCNALDDWLPKASLWLHGHLHCPSDYVVQGCRVVANPLGYAKKGEQVGFDARMVIEV